MRTLALITTAVLATPGALHAQGTLERYETACDSGDLVDCSVLALIYQSGAAGVRDLARAEILYDRACRRDVLSACRRLSLLREEGPGERPESDRVRVGYVADAYDGAPLGGAVVLVRGIAGVGERRYVSDVAGRVVLDPLPYGSHRIDVTRGGYTRMEGRVPVPWDGDFLILMEETAEEVASTAGGIFGQVTEQGTEDAVSDVDIVVTGGGRAISNRDGRFFIEDLEPGRVELRLERLGYEPRTLTVTVRRGRTIELYATLSPDPVELEPVRVSVASRYLERSGFYQRSQSVAGDRFTFRDIEAMSATTVGDVVRRAGGVTVLASQIGFGSEAISNRRRGGDAAYGRCRLRPYYNGTPLVDFNLELMPPDEIEALEVYQGANVPIEYFDEMQHAGASCGVVLIWTRDPRRAR